MFRGDGGRGQGRGRPNNPDALSGRYLDVARVGVEELSDDQQEEVHLVRSLVNLGQRREIQFTDSRCFYPKRLAISTFVRRQRNNIWLSVQKGCL